MTEPAEAIAGMDCQPDSNRNMLQYSILRIVIRVRERQVGAAGPIRVMIRTNLNRASQIRRQIIDRVERGLNYSTDFYDIPTRYDAQARGYCAEVLLSEVGYFEFKARVESARRETPWVRWAQGPNIGISVRPIEYGRDNSIYCAFIRQYVKEKDRDSLADPALAETIEELEQRGAYVLPPGGNFENFTEALPFIIEKLGMKIVHLLPINPVPTSYGRMGMYGSPYATTDYFGIDHTYAKFSHYKTIEDQFVDLTSTIHGLGARVFLDMVINHTGWASTIHFTHRDWRKVGKDGKIISPGAWGVVWKDLVELDYSQRALWRYMANVFLAWCQRGIDGFRLDAGYMVPLEVWQYIISKVRQEFPNTLFLLEGLGGPWETTETLLTEGQMNWAYSELFQNYNRSEVLWYLDYAKRVAQEKGVLVHYAETHDNDRLAKKGKVYARMRLHLCALTSFSGAWGFTNGVEWLATEKIDVHRNTALNWGSEDNLVEDIARLNKILAQTPAFWPCDNLCMEDANNEHVLAFLRRNADDTSIVACLINLDTEKPRDFLWDMKDNSLGPLLTDKTVLCDLLAERTSSLPAESVLRGTLAPGDCRLYRVDLAGAATPTVPAIYELDQDRIALIYRILLSRWRRYEIGRIEQEQLLRNVYDYRKFIVLVNQVSLDRLIRESVDKLLWDVGDELVDRYSAVWTFSARNKEFIISGEQWLVTRTYLPCTAYLRTRRGVVRAESIAGPDAVHHWCFFPPQHENERALLTFNWKVARKGKIERQPHRHDYPILCIPSGRRRGPARRIYPLALDKPAALRPHNTIALTNEKGGLCQCPVRPGALETKYDTLLSLPLDPRRPAERLSLVKMLKETVQVADRYFDLDESFLVSFTRYPQPLWEFVYDDGEYFLRIERSMVLAKDENTLYVRYKLAEANAPVTLTSKVYVECRSCHDQLQASDELRRRYADASHRLPGQAGLAFRAGSELALTVVSRHGAYTAQSHWIERLHHSQDEQRNLSARGDAFSPGFFRFELSKGRRGALILSTDRRSAHGASAQRAITAQNKRLKTWLALLPAPSRSDRCVRLLLNALDQFIVRDDSEWVLRTGLPWLGANVRESLHCVGGLLAGGRHEVAHDVVRHIARSERDGLLLDWLDGNTARTCVESSLLLFYAARQLADLAVGDTLWDRPVGDGRSLREVLVDIFEAFCDGRNPLVRLDEETGLLFCQAGSTWMNTTHPQATPRAGYPIEIQALWYVALDILAKLYPPHDAACCRYRERIEQKGLDLFWDETQGRLADVLAAPHYLTAEQASPDFALRFNQLAALHAGFIKPDRARKILDAISYKLLIPAALRSLSEDPLTTRLDVLDQHGHALLDPRRPYQGHCTGDETARRLAYHNGTAWLWPYPRYIEAWASLQDDTADRQRKALAFFEPIWTELVLEGIGTLGEMKDGNLPHTGRGCYAYAPSVAEALRVYMTLKYPTHNTAAASASRAHHARP